MERNQLTRFNKIYHEPIYLLDIKEEGNKAVFQVSGSTANIYKVSIYFSSKEIFCTCPDHTVHCKKIGCICKHCCFVLCKVLRVFNSESTFFDHLKFNDSEEESIKDAIKKS